VGATSKRRIVNAQSDRFPSSGWGFSVSASQVMLLAAQGKQPTRFNTEGNGDRGH
jgi:hypothetical protein